jgi:vacuolar-type H+-ATPase subunit I/STV1
METNEIEARIKDLERRVNNLTSRINILTTQVDKILERINKEEIKSNDLIKFLLSRESDIALDMENFGILRSVFKALIGREPKEEVKRNLEEKRKILERTNKKSMFGINPELPKFEREEVD